MQQQTIFHLAFPVTNITQAKAYYVDGLGCIPGRESRHALILNLYGHQLVAHLTKDQSPITNHQSPIPNQSPITNALNQDRMHHNPVPANKRSFYEKLYPYPKSHVLAIQDCVVFVQYPFRQLH